MPEGHTIHRLAKDLGRDLLGVPVRTDTRQDRFRDGARALDGAVLARATAYGKHLFLEFEGPGVLWVHLGLIGKFTPRSPGDPPSAALRLRLAADEVAWDLTGPMTCELREPSVIEEVTSRLGPDPLRRGARGDDFVAKVGRSRRPIGALLLDQSVIAGIGNVYRAEILHLTGIHPDRPGTSLSEEEASAIWDRCAEQLRLGVRRNRIVTVPRAGRKLASLSREDAVHVYKQERCRSCGGAVAVLDTAGRNMYACLACQR